ncbi:FkbM family methyltransferase [Tardiphaga sp.]|uniref:FkbM family methyltransferase n=1 Tax=Tardiphaga sp. TaxID=1926292 RepID=UPI0025F66C80|nr:FkbM family methyltransferase [Tardiphaga sp.]
MRQPSRPRDDELTGLPRPARLTSVVDIGANPIDGDPPYKSMLRQRLCRVTGFDPHPQALLRLNAAKSDLETYLPFAVGDGLEHTLRICRGLGFASLLQPDAQTLMHFPNFSELGRVVEQVQLPTRRLDDIAEIDAIDFLKIDIQGSELSVFKHGRGKLARAVVIQTEVSFVPLYEKQPVFGEIDLELRSLGFIPHMFAAINKKMIAPMLGPDPAAAINQLIEADLVYVRNFIHADTMDSEQLKHLALIAHHGYRSFDLALNCIHHLASRGEVSADAKNRYVAMLQAKPPTRTDQTL